MIYTENLIKYFKYFVLSFCHNFVIFACDIYYTCIDSVEIWLENDSNFLSQSTKYNFFEKKILNAFI